MLREKSLEEFGYVFLGPIFSAYMIDLNKKLFDLSKTKNIKVFHLAREGYSIQKAFELVNSKDIPSEYLNVSRTFLFRIMADIQASWSFSVNHKFEGTLEEFLFSRFAFTKQQITTLLDDDERGKDLVLPDDFDLVCDFLLSKKERIGQIVQPIREMYIEYLREKEFFNPDLMPVLLDVGYSGTIQKLLTILTNVDTHGVYMISTKSGLTKFGANTVHIDHVFKTGVTMGDGYMLLDRSMFLEALLTAPNGQFVDIYRDVNTGKFNFCYGKRTYTQEHFSDLSIVISGALSCLEVAIANNVTYSNTEIEMLFEAYVTQRNLLPRASWPLFILDDAISGQGDLNPLNFFGL